MEVVYECCCGLDVHKKSVTACLLKGSGARRQQELRTFGTTTRELLALGDWLRHEGCAHVAMESTGVYWKPVFQVLEEGCTIVLANAQHLKHVPGRKTDVKDAVWIADLLQHGLLRGSFVPPQEQRDVRELTRYRTSLVRERARVANRLQKVLEDAQIKLGDVLTDVLGVSGRAMLRAMAEGETDPERLAALAHGRLRNKQAALVEALRGRVRAPHRFLLREQLGHLQELDAAIDRVTVEVDRLLRPFEQAVALLDTIPGIDVRNAQVVLAEVGADMGRFPTSRHLASWAGLCPGHDESAGKRRSGKTRKGSPWLRHALIQAAHGASHAKHTYLAAQYRRIAARRGKKRALVAVAHSILEICYHVLRKGDAYKDLGEAYFDERDRTGVSKRLTRRLERLGYRVTLERAA
jgi:transposase